jgi:hypothetical protein
MRGECSAMRFSPARLPFSRPENEASRREPKQSRMPGEQILFSEDAIGQVEYCAKVGPNYARENSRGSGGSNPPLSTIQSLSFRTSRRIDRNPRVCARFAIMHGPRERPRRPESAESSKTYPGAIWLGPWIIAVNSPAHGTRRTDPSRP